MEAAGKRLGSIDKKAVDLRLCRDLDPGMSLSQYGVSLRAPRPQARPGVPGTTLCRSKLRPGLRKPNSRLPDVQVGVRWVPVL